MTPLLEDFSSFLKTSPTSWHCVKEVSSRLLQKGFLSLDEGSLWKIDKGGRYFVSRGGSIAAFCLPKKCPTQIILTVAHTDSPSLKVKPNPILTQNGMQLLQTEVYGGPILHSWLNRDLTIAGRCFVKDRKGAVKEELVFLNELSFMIPELAIHLNREVNEKGPLVNKQEHLMPLLSSKSQEEFPLSIESILKTKLEFESLLSFDLFLVPLEEPRFLGLEKEWIASYRIDNLASVHASTIAITSYKDSEILPLSVFFDHEEVGSKSWEGASSSFLQDILCRLKAVYALTEEEFLVLKRNSLALSLDMAHGLNPMYSQKHDPNHKPLLGEGIVLKHNADLKYASSAYTLSKAIQIAEKAKLKVQHFVSRSDMPCGSTVGPFITTSTGIPTVDLGAPQLSMHSARELMATQDYLDSVTFLTEALRPL